MAKKIAQKKDQKRNPKDDIALALLRQKPNAGIREISKDMKTLGIYSNERSYYERWFKHDYLRREWEETRQHAKETMLRVLFPVLFKELMAALKDKSMSRKDKFPYIRLGFDKILGVDHIPTPSVQQTVNVEKIQVYMQDMVQKRSAELAKEEEEKG